MGASALPSTRLTMRKRLNAVRYLPSTCCSFFTKIDQRYGSGVAHGLLSLSLPFIEPSSVHRRPLFWLFSRTTLARGPTTSKDTSSSPFDLSHDSSYSREINAPNTPCAGAPTKLTTSRCTCRSSPLSSFQSQFVTNVQCMESQSVIRFRC